ncbi:MAG: hypothetical protein BWX82_00426 [Parcubacteria group bacterium ADurb.Bin115]|nr:MAG: hypothetical protein BWX82_00426 [Parcubacteria group bacterium ADurb.Bin115]
MFLYCSRPSAQVSGIGLGVLKFIFVVERFGGWR